MLEIINFFKKNTIAIFLVSLWIFLVIWLGNVMVVVTSRAILDPLNVTIDGLNSQDIKSVSVLAELSRAGNIIYLGNTPNTLNQWDNSYNTFIKTLFIRISDNELKNISNIKVDLGKKSFNFNGNEFVTNWKIQKINNEELLFGSKDNGVDYHIYGAPINITSNPLNFPLAPGIFSSLNFNGSDKLIKYPLLSSIKLFCLVELVLLFLLLLFFKFARRNQFGCSPKDDYLSKQVNFLIGFFAICATLIILFVINVLLQLFYNPDTSQTVIEAAKIYRSSILPSFLPEPVERVQFVLSVVLSPFILLISLLQIKKYFNRLSSNSYNKLYYFASIASFCMIFALIYIGLAVSNFLYVKSSYFFNGIGLYFYALLFPIGFTFLIFFKFNRYNEFLKKTIYIVCLLLLALIFLVNIFSINSSTDLINAFHLDPIIYPMSQVVVGKTILVNVSSLYGLYPAFLEGVFHFWKLNVFSLTVVMGFLLVVSYGSILLFFRREITNKIIMLLGFSSAVFYFLENLSNPAPYFQYWPIRLIFPCIMLLVVSYYSRSKKDIYYFFGFFISSLSILWNFDSGIIVFLSWVIVLCCEDFYLLDKKIAIKSAFQHILIGAYSVCLIFYSYSTYTFFRSGEFPHLSQIIQYQKMFVSGYFMIPMTFPHVWLLAAVVFLVGLFIVINGLFDAKADRQKNFIILFVSVMGLGLFSYFQGRSHDLTFYAPVIFALVLLTLLTDIVYHNFVNNHNNYAYGMILVIIIFFMLASPLNLIYNSGKYLSWLNIRYKAFFQHSDNVLIRNVDFIKKNTEKGDNILILSSHSLDGVYYAESGTRAVIDLPASTDMFLIKEVEYLEYFLKCNSKTKIFVYPKSEYIFYDININKILDESYEVIAMSDSNMAMLQKSNSSTNSLNDDKNCR